MQRGKRLILLIVLMLSVLGLSPVARSAPAQNVSIELFSRAGCPRCAKAKLFLENLQREEPSIRVRERRIDQDAVAREELRRRLKAAGVNVQGVPTLFVNGNVIVGFDAASTTGERIRALAKGGIHAPATVDSSAMCTSETEAPCEAASVTDSVSTSFGRLSASELGLPLFTLALGLLDGFNPCAMWVLLFLLAMLANLKDRKRMALIAGVFVFASGAVYFAFMAAWLNVFMFIGISRWVERVFGAVALVVGAINVKDFFAFRRGVSLSIPERAKPSIYVRVREILRAESLIASLFGVTVLAVLVNFVELLCTAGFPAVYTAVLAKQQLSWLASSAYLLLYILAYVADDALMVGLAVFTLSHRKLTERGGRVLKLVSGVTMLSLALGLLVFPDWLS